MGLVEFAVAGRGGSADLGHTVDLSIVNAGRKCEADLLWICKGGEIYAANPMWGCLEIWGSLIRAAFTLNYKCGSVAGLQRNMWIWMQVDFMLGILHMNVLTDL